MVYKHLVQPNPALCFFLSESFLFWLLKSYNLAVLSPSVVSLTFHLIMSFCTTLDPRAKVLWSFLKTKGETTISAATGQLTVAPWLGIWHHKSRKWVEGGKTWHSHIHPSCLWFGQRWLLFIHILAVFINSCFCAPCLYVVWHCVQTALYKCVVSSVLRCGRCVRVSSSSPGLGRGAPVSAVWAVAAGTSRCPRSDRVAAGRGGRHWGGRCRPSLQPGENHVRVMLLCCLSFGIRVTDLSVPESVFMTSQQIHCHNLLLYCATRTSQTVQRNRVGAQKHNSEC